MVNQQRTAQAPDAVCLGCVDSALGTPRHYHQPSDIPAHLDMTELMRSVDFAERLCIAIIERRTWRLLSIGVGAHPGGSGSRLAWCRITARMSLDRTDSERTPASEAS